MTTGWPPSITTQSEWWHKLPELPLDLMDVRCMISHHVVEREPSWWKAASPQACDYVEKWGSATPDQMQSIRVSGGGGGGVGGPEGGCQAPAAAVSGEINAKPSLLRGELFVSDTSTAPGCLSFLCLLLTIATNGESLWTLNAQDEKIVLRGVGETIKW